MLTALCNIYLNSSGALEKFQESFPLVYEISDNWLINIRGKEHDAAIAFIKKTFPNSEATCTIFSGLDDTQWAASTTLMLKSARYEYLYVYLEDHFLMKPLSQMREVIKEMMKLKLDYLQYSFFNVGLNLDSLEVFQPDQAEHLFHFTFKPEHIALAKKTNPTFYPYALPSISRLSFFKKLLTIEERRLIKIPRTVQGILENVYFIYPRNRQLYFKLNGWLQNFGLRIVIYTPGSPFNLEKSLHDCDASLLPYELGVLREELFANWDDDNGVTNTSLIRRGLYPRRLQYEQKTPKLAAESFKEETLKKKVKVARRYHPNTGRISTLPLKVIRVHEGSVRISGPTEEHTLHKGETITLYANIPHTLEAIEDLRYSYAII